MIAWIGGIAAAEILMLVLGLNGQRPLARAVFIFSLLCLGVFVVLVVLLLLQLRDGSPLWTRLLLSIGLIVVFLGAIGTELSTGVNGLLGFRVDSLAILSGVLTGGGVPLVLFGWLASIVTRHRSP